MENEKKIILVNGNGSRWYEQAIFIINKNETSVPKNIVLEAEKIINEHLNKKYNNKLYNAYNSYSTTNVSPKKANKSLNLCLNLFIFCTISIIICLAYLILS